MSENQVALQFPQAVKFHVHASSAAKIVRATLIYGTEGPGCQVGGARQMIEFTPAGEVDLEWLLELKRSGIFPPGTVLWWQWELADESGATLLTDRQTQLINDPRHKWSRIEQHGVTLQWYDGDEAFGQRLIYAISNHLDRLSASMGLRADGHIWITVYPTVDEMKEVLLHTYEWTGAVAFPSYGGILIPISPSDTSSWAINTLAHEITHLLVAQTTFNCEGVGLPTWLDEGLAENGEGNISQEYRASVLAALKADTLPPLRTLEQGFSSDSRAANLSYAQSALVLEYLLKQGDAQDLGQLLAATKNGVTIDLALISVYGFDTDGLDARWRQSLGFTLQPTSTREPKKTGTVVPTLPLWTSVVRPSATATVTPTPAPATPEPGVTPTPAATAAPKTSPVLPFCPASLVAPAALAAVWYFGRPRRRDHVAR